MKLNCIVIDDEPVACDGMNEYIKEISFLNPVGVANSAMKAVKLLEKEKVDLMFLDIKMPNISGIDFLKMLKNPPLVIFTTANAGYAIEGFTLDVLDYLVKPISFERFRKACEKAKEFYELKRGAYQQDPEENYFFVKCNGKYEKILFDELLFVEAANNYVVIHLKDKQLITYLTFKGIEENLPASRFLKVHKSYIVSLAKIENLDGKDITIGKHTIPISRNMREEVLEKIVNKKLIRR